MSAAPHPGALLFERDGATLRAHYATHYRCEQLFVAAANSSVFAENRLSDLACYAEDHFPRIGLLNSLHVPREKRGQGLGRALMQEFKEKVIPHTDIDLVFARVTNPQAPGFQLLKFYQDYGFEPVYSSGGEMLMATKGHERELTQLFQQAPSFEL